MGVVAFPLFLFFLRTGHISAWIVAFAVAIAAMLTGFKATRQAPDSADPSSTVWLARGGAVLGLVFVGVTGLFVWEALQRKGRPSSSEGSVLGQIRTLISAEAAYQAASGGSYGPPDCLAAPTTCLRAYPVNQPAFLDSAQLSRKLLAAQRAAATSILSRTPAESPRAFANPWP